jgi:nucleoside-diphosphate-sugar epimerase
MLALGLCRDAEGQVVNIGSGVEWSIRQTVDLLCEILHRRVTVETEAGRIRPELSEVQRLVADNRRIAELTGWRSQYVPNGLERTVRWIEQNLPHFSPEVYAR